jgi:hypothetical protein
VGFDIALMGGLGLVGLLAHQIGGGKACLHVAVAEVDVFHDVAVHAFRHRMVGHAFADHRGTRGHRGIDIGDMRQNLVGPPRSAARHLAPDQLGCRGHGGDGMAVIQCHLARKGVFLQVPVLAGQPGGKIGPRHHRLHPGRASALEASMRLIRAWAWGSARRRHAACRGPRCPRHSARGPSPCPNRRGGRGGCRSDDIRLQFILRHHAAPRISAAASCTARMILS